MRCVWGGLKVMEALDCMELAVGENTVESLWVRIKEQANKGCVVLRVYYRLHRHHDNTDELFCKEPRDTSRSVALDLMKDFNLPDVSWEYHSADTRETKRFLKHIDDNFLV